MNHATHIANPILRRPHSASRTCHETGVSTAAQPEQPLYAMLPRCRSMRVRYRI